MKHFLFKTNEHYLCVFFNTMSVNDLYCLLGTFVMGVYKYDDEMPEYDVQSGQIKTAREGSATAKGAVSYPTGYEGYDYICLQFNLIKQ